MSITKAFLLTLLITLIELAVQFISYISYDIIEFSSGLDHLFGIAIILSRIIAYGIVFYFFWKKDFNLNRIHVPDFKSKILIYLILMTLGLRFIGEPFWDFKHIFGSAEILFYQFEGVDPDFFYRSISTLLIAPIVEELFFRKFLISRLIKKYSKHTALIVSAILFAAIHWETLSNLVPAFIFGIIGGTIYLKTRKISYLILLHFLYNFLGMIISINGELYSDVILWLNYGILYWSFFLLGIIVTLVALRQIPGAPAVIILKK